MELALPKAQMGSSDFLRRNHNSLTAPAFLASLNAPALQQSLPISFGAKLGRAEPVNERTSLAWHGICSKLLLVPFMSGLRKQKP